MSSADNKVAAFPSAINLRRVAAETLDEAYDNVEERAEVAAVIISVMSGDGKYATRVLHIKENLHEFDAVLRCKEFLDEWVRARLASWTP